MKKPNCRLSACTDQQRNRSRFSACEPGVFESSGFFGRRGFMDFVKRLVRGLLPKFRQPRPRSQAACLKGLGSHAGVSGFAGTA